MRVFENANYKFLDKRRTFYAVSAVALGIGLVLALMWQFTRGSWLNYGVDFTGGTLVQVRFENAVSAADLREVIEPAFPGTEITRFGADNEYLIRTAGFAEDGENVSDALVEVMEERFGAGQFTVTRTEAVGPKVGGELQRRALIAVLLSLAATLIYLAFRFEWRFGVACVAATAHDTLFTLFFISALRLDVSLTTVAAVLTIIGYSLNDTIVIFDRIRENLKKLGRKIPFAELEDRSINETLPRTVLTGTTSLGTLLALFIFTTGVIREFALIMIVGILVGTYSSIFIASPLLLEIEKRWPVRTKTTTTGRRSTRSTPSASANV